MATIVARSSVLDETQFRDADLDLVEVAPNSDPPVAKIMDFGKFKYEAAQKAKEARRNQANTVLKEVRFRLKIDTHDYETKTKRAIGFLTQGEGKPELRPFDVIDILRTPYRIDIHQPVYFVIERLDDLFAAAERDLLADVATARKLGLHAPKYPPKAA